MANTPNINQEKLSVLAALESLSRLPNTEALSIFLQSAPFEDAKLLLDRIFNSFMMAINDSVYQDSFVELKSNIDSDSYEANEEMISYLLATEPILSVQILPKIINLELLTIAGK